MLIFLVGFAGAGKTTIGRKLARQLKYNFVDTDQLICEQTGISVDEIFTKKGESHFRELESQIISQIISYKDTVVSTGGGLPCFNGTMHQMNQSGLTVFLKVNVGILFKRLVKEKSTRPLLKNLSSVEIMEFITYHMQLREPYYKQSKQTVNADELSGKNWDEFIAKLKIHLNN